MYTLELRPASLGGMELQNAHEGPKSGQEGQAGAESVDAVLFSVKMRLLALEAVLDKNPRSQDARRVRAALRALEYA